MNIYPALKAQMGTWTYYTVKMTARELSRNVLYASEVYEDRTLDEAIQRELKEGRVKKEIVSYLKNQVNRFFSSIVVAAWEGNPLFYPVEVTDDPRFVLFRNDRRINETFGVLHFDGTQKYYALDGQHRLAAIRTLLDRNDPLSDGAPENFENDEFSVIVIVPDKEDTNETFMQKYRRLFSNLNRYAKPMDQATNIIMDEDDAFAIITRRLIAEHDFFKWAGKARESERVKTKKGKNLTSRDPYFTSIETLYEMNITLLKSQQRETAGWGPVSDEGEKEDTFKRFRPPEEYIDNLYDELLLYWNGLLAELPVLHSKPCNQMRIHELDKESSDETDHLLFWPIGQQMLAEIARTLLNKCLSDPANPTPDDIQSALKGLAELEWRLHQAPWRYFLLVKNAQGKWAMRNEQRTQAVRCGQIIQQWILGLEDDDENFVENLKREWTDFLTPAQSQETVDELWQKVEKMKSLISG